MPAPALSAQDLSEFRNAQQLAYRCAETIAGELKPGVSEKEAAALMKTWLQDHGVKDWFGPRTVFKGFDGLRHLGGFNLAFYPGKQQLEEGMPHVRRWQARQQARQVAA